MPEPSAYWAEAAYAIIAGTENDPEDTTPVSAHHARGCWCLYHARLPEQAMEDVKEELRALKEGGRGDLTGEQYELRQQVLLMKWYRTTGPAKLEAGIKHIEGLIEQGDLLSSVA